MRSTPTMKRPHSRRDMGCRKGERGCEEEHLRVARGESTTNKRGNQRLSSLFDQLLRLRARRASARLLFDDASRSHFLALSAARRANPQPSAPRRHRARLGAHHHIASLTLQRHLRACARVLNLTINGNAREEHNAVGAYRRARSAFPCCWRQNRLCALRETATTAHFASVPVAPTR